ncbi:MAG: hypothetical protein IH983_10085 [Planctomycetes bacterium]|nr:hypothetical protein [Planctomycetota bacterium]
MRCKNCDYALWNLKARLCPECGTPFRPSEYEFAPGKIQFRCPHCEQKYFGTSDRGHLEPSHFECSNCGNRIHMDEMIVAPADGITEQQTAVDRMPWLERGQGRVFKAWFAMIKWAMIEPHRVIRATPADTSIGRAWLFGLVTAVIFLTFGAYIPLLVYGTAVSFGPGQSGFSGLWFSIGGIATIVFGSLAVGLYILAWAGIAHGILRVTGGTAHTFRRTCHAICYSAPAGVVLAVPCCNILFGLVWWIASAAIMVKEAHKVHGARAALAVFVWPVLSVYIWQILSGVQGFIIAGMLIPMFVGGGPFGGGFGGGGMALSNETFVIMQAVSSYDMQANGQGPAHAIELVVTDSIYFGPLGGGFCHQGTKTTTADIPVGDGTFKDFTSSSRSVQFGLVKNALESVPANLVAHRFGDFVFVYHGATLNTWDAQLWTVVMIPDPDVNGSPAANDPIYIGTAGYTVSEITFSQLPAQIKQQNQHRATLGLPPLPDLTTVTHDKPAVAGQQPTGGDPNEE